MRISGLWRVDVHGLLAVHGFHPEVAVLFAEGLEGVDHAGLLLGDDVEAEPLVDGRVRHSPDAALQLKRLVGHDLGCGLKNQLQFGQYSTLMYFEI